MNDSIGRLLSQSASDFQNRVWPIASDFARVGGGLLRPVEAVTTADFGRDLDQLAGIDAWQVDPDTPMMRGLASRVQWGRPYNTFSIRYRVPSGQPTEFQKRATSLRNKHLGHLYPFLTVQAYLDEPGGTVLSCAVIETETLFRVAVEMDDKGIFQNSQYPDRFGIQELPNGTQFIYLSWDFLGFHGHLLHDDVYERPVSLNRPDRT